MEILEDIHAIKEHEAGKTQLRLHTVKAPGAPREIRARMGVSQAAFAGMMGVSVRTVQDWEQGRRRPSGPAEAFLRIAEQKPEVFSELE